MYATIQQAFPKARMVSGRLHSIRGIDADIQHYEKQECSLFFKSVIETIQNNYASIINYFDNRSTNVSTESFNAKIKALRAQF